jgi:butyrate kinase
MEKIKKGFKTHVYHYARMDTTHQKITYALNALFNAKNVMDQQRLNVLNALQVFCFKIQHVNCFAPRGGLLMH